METDPGDTTSSSSQSSSETTSEGGETSSGTDDASATTSSSETSSGTTGDIETSGSSGAVTESSESGGEGSCGNGAPDDGEICDDGNEIGGDGCEVDCTSSDDVEPIWTLELGGPTGYVDCGTGVAFDSEGNLILGAYTEPDVIWIRKYDVDYVEQWTVTYPGQAGGSCPRTRVAIDAEDNIGFVGGLENGDPSISGMFFGMLDADGGELWTIDPDEPGIIAEVPGDLAFDPDGNMLLSAGVVPLGGMFTDLYVAKYDPLGGLIWNDTYDGVGGLSDIAFGIDADVDGNVLVAGVIRGAGDDNDIFVRSYDADGGEQWTDIVLGAAGETDFGQGVAMLDTDAIVAGIIRDTPGDGDAWVRRYQTDGSVSWTQTYSGTANTEGDGALDVAVAANGSILAAGGVVDIEGSRYWLARLDDEGEVIWARRRVESGVWYAVASAPDGRIAVGGAAFYPFPLDMEARFAVYPP